MNLFVKLLAHQSIRRFAVPVAIVLGVLLLGLSAPVVAQDDVDFSDNETCMECHADTERGPPKNPDRPQVHTADGGFHVEDHEMWSCNDCHDYITEIPHPDEVLGSEVDCTNCHDEAPTK
jgi:hypothetical protein